MTNETIVAIGLLADAVGALGIVVPDLPSRYRSRIQYLTPILRRYVQTEEELTNYARDLPAAEEMYQRVRSVESAFATYSKSDRFEDFDPDIIESADWKTNAILNLRDESGQVVEEVQITRVRGAIREYIERVYRLWGWVLLATGFFIQLIGTIL